MSSKDKIKILVASCIGGGIGAILGVVAYNFNLLG